MSNTVLYIITTWNDQAMYQYIFEFEYIEYFKEPEERAKIEKAFFEKSGITGEKIIDIKEADFIRYIK